MICPIVIVCPIAAVTLAQNIANLINLVNTNDELQKRIVLDTLTKVFSTLEAREAFTDPTPLIVLFRSAPSFVHSSSWRDLVELIDMATGTVSGLNAVQATKDILLPLFYQDLTENISKKHKWHINRILARIGAQLG